jgi:ElaB/YqjD/DUF883 family membrane-anchored ribosome-binding protein
MDPEAEVIREQMEDTRESLAKKLETLEKDIAGAVENVTGTVEAVSHTVEQVKETVGETVDTVKEKIRETFDIPGHVRCHPWLGFGISFAGGFLTGRLVPPVLPNLLAGGASRESWAAPSMSTLAESGRHDGWRPQERREGPPAAPRQEAPRQEARGPGWMASLASTVGPELDKLKRLAIGAMLGMARDAITRALPPETASQLKEVVNDFTAKVGGEVMHGPVLGPSPEGGRREASCQPQHGPAPSSGSTW